MIVMHADLDAFFASVEEREDPSLRGRPVVIGADPKGGRGRGIVATANYEARKAGIRSALPISTAWRLCPGAVFLRPRFALYDEASRRVMEILRPAADVFEQAGLDEAYLDVSSLGTFEAARALARRLKSEVAGRERLSLSIGVGPNKLIAKIASDHHKPDGLTVVLPSRVLEFLGPKDVGVLLGVGPKTRERLLVLGYNTVGSLKNVTEAELVREFGRFGTGLWQEARGEDNRPVDPAWETKSIGREHTFPEDTADWEEVRRTLLECVSDVYAQMRQEGFWCRTLTVKIRFEGYETHSRQRTLKLAVGYCQELEASALDLLEVFRRRGKRIRLIGFSASRFSPPEELLPLFVGPTSGTS